MILVVRVPVRTESEANVRKHWRSRARDAARQRGTTKLCCWGPMRELAASLAPLTVTLTRVAPSGGLDGDNLQAALKATRDGVADALAVDDGDPRVTWRYGQQRSRPGVYAVDVEVVRG